MKKSIATILILTMGWCITSIAQTISSEKTIDISKKANKGYLGNVVVDDNRKQIDMVFVTRSNNRKVKFEVYQFDYDLNLINEFADEQEATAAREKYNWFSYRGEDEYTVTGITAKADLAGKATFERKEISYKYNWFTGKYKKKEKVLDKVKPKTEYGKMFFYQSYQLDQVGEVLALVGIKGEKLKNFDVPYKQMKVLRVNSDLEIVNEEDITFEYIQYPIWSGPIREGAMEEDDEETGDWAFVVQPRGGQGMGKFAAPDARKYTYVRVGRDGMIKDRIEFTSKGNSWKIDGAYEKNGGVYLYGPCKDSKKPEK